MQIRLYVLALLAMACAKPPAPQSAAPVSSGPCLGPVGASGDEDLSDHAYAWFATAQLPSGQRELCVLVVWRGAPGWHTARQAAIRGALKGGLLDTAKLDAQLALGNARGVSSIHEFLGDLELHPQYDPRRRILTVNGHTIDLSASNFVVIEHADSASPSAQTITWRHIDFPLDSLIPSRAELLRHPLVRAAAQ